MEIAIIDTTGVLDGRLVAGAAAAINTQVRRDVAAVWNVRAGVRHVRNGGKVPAGAWPVWLVDRLPGGGTGGFHLDQHRRPYAKVIATATDDGWTIAVSHEIIEMLVDPFGNRMCYSTSIKLKGGRIVHGSSMFEYLVEACDPCEGKAYGYRIHGIAVSDFVTPEFYESVGTRGARYTFKDNIAAPRRILPGGYITWLNPTTNRWHQCHHHTGAPRPTINNIANPVGPSVREWVDAATARMRATYNLNLHSTTRANGMKPSRSRIGRLVSRASTRR